MESRNVLCCSARTWSLVIGWVQTISSAVALGVSIYYLCFYVDTVIEVSSTVKPEVEEGYELVVLTKIMSIISLLISLIAGVTLIVGVIQGNAERLKVWIVIEGILIIFSIITVMLGFVSGDGFGGLIQKAAIILDNIFFIWVVNIHREELEGQGLSGSQLC